MSTAIALAGCAFESYNEPAGVAEAWKEWAVSGTYTTYVHRCRSSCRHVLPKRHASTLSHVPHRFACMCLHQGRRAFACIKVSRGRCGQTRTSLWLSLYHRAFMKESLAGILEVHLKSATGLPARDVSHNYHLALSPFAKLHNTFNVFGL